MKHTIRQRVINSLGCPATKIVKIDGELGSGLFDKNGREIFEGDKVDVYIADNKTCTDTIVFRDGGFFALHVLVTDIDARDIEVVGHADD